MTTRLLGDSRRLMPGAPVKRHKGRQRRCLKDDPGSRQEPQVPSERAHRTWSAYRSREVERKPVRRRL